MDGSDAEPRKVRPDWAQIETAYRATARPLRDIASQHGITHAAIQKRARRDGWTRNLSAAELLVAKRRISRNIRRLLKNVAVLMDELDRLNALDSEPVANTVAKNGIHHRNDAATRKAPVTSQVSSQINSAGTVTHPSN